MVSIHVFEPVAAVSAPRLSHHLRVVREAGLVIAARRGRWVDYWLSVDAPQRRTAPLPFGAAVAGSSR